MVSLWLDRPLPSHGSPPPGRVDVAVVGAGLTGLTTALLLARAGAAVAVLEARHVGAATTGGSTGKVTLLQGTKLARMSRRHSAATVRSYVEGNRAGQAWLLRWCAEHGVPVDERDDLVLATTAKGRDDVGAAHDAAHDAGVPVEWLESVPELPFPTTGAARLPGQAQIDPVAVLLAMAEDLAAHGGTVHEGWRVHGLGAGRPARLTMHASGSPGEERETVADRVVLATGAPIFDRGGFFARLVPGRSHGFAFRVPGPVPQLMAITADGRTRSLRTADVGDGERLVVIGAGHKVGTAEPVRPEVEELRRWVEETFPGAEVTHQWSAQDYRPTDRLPSVGSLVPGSDRVLTATGYDKWGLAVAVAAALTMSATILGDDPPDWSHPIRTWRPGALLGADRAVILNARVAGRLLRDRTAPRVRSSAVVPPEGLGRVERDDGTDVAVSTVDGTTRRVSATCTHLGGVVTWNDADRSWDCPLHGSRFAPDGTVLEGPATCPLDLLGTPGGPAPDAAGAGPGAGQGERTGAGPAARTGARGEDRTPHAEKIFPGTGAERPGGGESGPER